MALVQIITPPRKHDHSSYSCIIDFENKPYEVRWSGSQQYPNVDDFPFVGNASIATIVLEPQIASIWKTSSPVDFGSHASIRVSRSAEGERFPIIKLAHPDAESEKLIQHEFTILQALGTTNLPVVKTYQIPIEVHGRTYGYWMEQLWPMSHEEQKERASDVGKVVQRLHAAGYEHGDLSPSNIMRNKEGELVLIDFSSAKVRVTNFPTDTASLRTFWGLSNPLEYPRVVKVDARNTSQTNRQ